MGGIVMGEIEFGTCDICGKETELERTYFYYPIHCECCGSKDKDGQKQHFELVHHCKERIVLHLCRKKFILCLEV